MKMKIVTILDSKANAFTQPMFFQSLGQAERSFSDICHDPDHAMGKHPADYTMLCIGDWDEREGIITLSDTRVLVAEGIQMMSGDVAELR